MNTTNPTYSDRYIYSASKCQKCGGELLDCGGIFYCAECGSEPVEQFDAEDACSGNT